MSYRSTKSVKSGGSGSIRSGGSSLRSGNSSLRSGSSYGSKMDDKQFARMSWSSIKTQKDKYSEKASLL